MSRRITPPPTPSPQGEGERGFHGINNRLGIVRAFAANADDAPAFALQVSLAFCVVFGATREIVYLAVDLDGDT